MRKLIYILIFFLFVPLVGRSELSIEAGPGINFFVDWEKEVYGTINPSFNFGINLRTSMRIELFLQGELFSLNGTEAIHKNTNYETTADAKLVSYSIDAGLRYFFKGKLNPFIGIAAGLLDSEHTVKGGVTRSLHAPHLSLEAGFRLYKNNLFLELKSKLLNTFYFTSPRTDTIGYFRTVLSLGIVVTKR